MLIDILAGLMFAGLCALVCTAWKDVGNEEEGE